MQRTDVTSVLERLAQVLGTRTGSQLADALGVSPQTISSWKSRESVPYAQCVSVAGDWGIRLDWLLTGEGPMFRGETESAGDGHVAAHAPAQEPDLPELLSQLADSARREQAAAATQQERLTAIEKQLQELQAAVAALTRSP